ncbi:MAG: tryptophan-rich sensory protein [Alphaproteobacteria bacterium]|nr:tryptophan-rich sensory protein [Alphaproteobacteria bacterium]
MTREKIRRAGRLLFLLLLVHGIGYIGGGYMTPEVMAWYHGLTKSALTPPDAVFGAVWSVLYTLMAVAAWIVWGRVSPRWFVLQLAANGLWPFVFFHLRMPAAALAVLIIMIGLLGRTMRGFSARSHLAAGLLAPTLAWGLFAAYLNAWIVVMN